MKTGNYFRYLLAALFLGCTINAMAQEVWSRGTTQGTDIWYWYRNTGTNGTDGKGNDISVTPANKTYGKGEESGWSEQGTTGNEVTRLQTGYRNNYRVVVESLKLTTTVPAGKKIQYTYELEAYINLSAGGSTPAACELFYWGNTDNTKSFTYQTPANASQSDSQYSLCKAYVGKKGSATQTKTVTFVYDNTKGKSAKKFVENFAVLSYVRFVSGGAYKTATSYVKSNLIDKTEVDDNPYLALGNLYMDFQNQKSSTNDNNSNYAKYVNPSNNDGLRLATDVKKENNQDKIPYLWGSKNQSSNEFSVSINTKRDDNVWRVGVGMFRYSPYVPAYASLQDNCTYQITASKTGNTTHQGAHGAELIHYGESEWKPNTTDQFSTSSSASSVAGGTSIVKCFENQGNSISNTIYYHPISYSNATGSVGRYVNNYFSLTSFVYRNGNKDVSESATVKFTRGNQEITYYAYITYNGNGDQVKQTWNAQNPQTISGNRNFKGNLHGNFFTNGDKQFVEWNTKADGTGTSYKENAQFSPYTSADGGRGVGPVTLYAIWKGKTTKLKLTNRDQNDKVVDEYLILDNEYQSSKYASLNGKKDKDGKLIQVTPREGFIFEGWECQADGSLYQVYDRDGNAVEGKFWVKNSTGNLVWNNNQDEINLTARWIEAAEVATVSIQVVRSNNYEGTNVNHTYVGATVGGLMSIADFKGDGYITVDGIRYLSCEAVKNGNDVKENLLSTDLEHATVWHFEKTTDKYGRIAYNISTIKDGEKLYLGNRVSNTGEVMDAGIGIQKSEPTAKFTIYDAGEGKGWVCFDEEELESYNHVLYMQNDENHYWEFENSHHNAQYRPIRILAAGKVLTDMSTETIIKTIKEELASPGDDNSYPYAYNVGSKPDVNDKDLCNGVLYVDMSTIAGFEETNKTDLENFQKETSANCLFFMPNGTNVRSDNTTILEKNAVHKLSSRYEAVADLIIKDKMPFSSPYKFYVGNGYEASYTRDFAKWSSLFLPFPAKANGKVKFYELYGSDDLRLAYQSIESDVVSANEAIACLGEGTFTLTNTDVYVEADPADFAKEPYKREVVAFTSENIREFAEKFPNSQAKDANTTERDTWNVVGVRFCRYIYGPQYTGDLPNGSNVEQSLVYYFSNGNFSYVNPTGRVRFTPFRAYYQPANESSMKSYSVIAFDSEGGATDITDIMTGAEAEGDGKIYDLQGRRVMNPLKGHIYIVNGQKKQY